MALSKVKNTKTSNICERFIYFITFYFIYFYFILLQILWSTNSKFDLLETFSVWNEFWYDLFLVCQNMFVSRFFLKINSLNAKKDLFLSGQTAWQYK